MKLINSIHVIEIDSRECLELALYIYDYLVFKSLDHDGDMDSFDKTYCDAIDMMRQFALRSGDKSIVDELRRQVNPNIIKNGREQSSGDNKVDDLEKGISKGH